MGRPKKSVNAESEDILISKESVESVVEFANAMYNGLGGFGYFATPFTQNQNLVSLNNNPRVPTYEKILEALRNSPMDGQTLCGYSEFMEVWDTIYGKTIDYLTGLLAFNIGYKPTNMKDPSKEMSSQPYKDDIRRVEKFLRTFNYKQEFRKIVKEVLRHETSYVWFRDTRAIYNPIDIEEDDIKKNEKFALQMLPQNFCVLTGYVDGGELLYDFNMNYFLNGTVDINLFAPELKKKFKETFTDTSGAYVPSAQLSNRNGSFATYVQCSPNDGAYAFKFDISNFRQVPPLASLMKSVFDNTTIEQLQKDKDIASAYALLMGEIKTYDNAKSGTQPNQYAISKTSMGQFLALVQSGLQKNIKPVALPLEETRLAQFTDGSPLMSNYKLKESSGQGASASSLIYTDGKMAQFEMQQAVETDYAKMKPLYYQFCAFLNRFVNQKTSKYKFEFTLDGLDREFYRMQKLKDYTQLANVGLVMGEQELASCLNMTPFALKKSLEMAHYGDMTSLLTPLLNINTMKDGSNPSSKEVGNQEKDSNEITDSGANSRDYN